MHFSLVSHITASCNYSPHVLIQRTPFFFTNYHCYLSCTEASNTFICTFDEVTSYWQDLSSCDFVFHELQLLNLCVTIKTFFHNPRAMLGGLLLLLPSAWSACPDHQGVPKWFRVSIGETMIGQKEGPRLRPWTILGDPIDHPTPSNGELVDSPWQEATLAIRWKQLLWSANIFNQHRT